MPVLEHNGYAQTLPFQIGDIGWPCHKEYQEKYLLSFCGLFILSLDKVIDRRFEVHPSGEILCEIQIQRKVDLQVLISHMNSRCE